jgi:hypothetical protein
MTRRTIFFGLFAARSLSVLVMSFLALQIPVCP